MVGRPEQVRGRRVMVYDRGCGGVGWRPGLSDAWRLGASLYGLRGALDAWQPADSWTDAFAWLARQSSTGPLEEVQFWGHGHWGCAMIGADRFDGSRLAGADSLATSLDAVKLGFASSRALGVEPSWWFRTCETIGANRGQTFACALAERLDARVAGHTYIIGPWQSGLHSVAPGETPRWSTSEAILEGDPESPRRAAWSTPWAPNTIHCLRPSRPPGY